MRGRGLLKGNVNEPGTFVVNDIRTDFPNDVRSAVTIEEVILPVTDVTCGEGNGPEF